MESLKCVQKKVTKIMKKMKTNTLKKETDYSSRKANTEKELKRELQGQIDG